MSKIIQANNLAKSYTGKKVLEDVYIDIGEGKFTTLIGSNGAGKSTLLRLIAGVEAPDHGEIKVLGGDPFAFQYNRRSEVFFIHENIDVEFSVNLLEMVKIYREVFPMWNNDLFNKLLKERKISIKKKYSELSRGQKMQFLLMMALASKPKILLLDEITSVIDIEGQRYFLDKIKEFTEQGGTVIITTNILSELNDYTDHLILLQQSKMMINASMDEMQKKYVLLKKSEAHPIFDHPEAVKVKKDFDGKALFVIERSIAGTDVVEKFGTAYPVKLDEILVLHFHLREDEAHEELVA